VGAKNLPRPRSVISLATSASLISLEPVFPRLDQANKKLRPLLERRKRLTAIRKLIEKQIAGDDERG
jgi:hypothetical protein